MHPIEEQGYVIVAINTDIDYVDCARVLAQSIKSFNSAARVCLITNVDIQDVAFDHVRQFPAVFENPFANDSQIFKLSPFRETIKLEADMLIAGPIDHWWNLFRNRDIVISTGCRNWRGNISPARNYRRVFDENQLPDVYNAITYWRRSTQAKEFFDLTRDIFGNWAQYRMWLKGAPDVPDTDLVYALAAQIIGPELVTLPFVDYPQIVHMKRHHAGTQTEQWTHELVWEQSPLRINTVAQWGAFHYNTKDWRP